MAEPHDTLEYLAARAVAGILGALPAPAARGTGSTLGGFAYRMGARRGVVRTQIAAAFPDREAAWVETTAAACYRHFGREAAEIARLHRAGAGPVRDRVTADPAAERWMGRMAAGRGTVIVTGHLGNWEIAGALLAARDVPLAAVVKRQRNRRFDAWLAASRRRLGVEPVYMDEAPRVVPRLLAAGRSVALVADQDARSRGLGVTFLDRPASVFRGPARLALAARAPLVFGVALREGNGYVVRVEPVWSPDRVERTGPGEPSELELTRRWVGCLDRWVRRQPEQYFWFHRRWKSAGRANRNEGGPGAVHRADAGGRAGSGADARPGSRLAAERLERSEGNGDS